MERRVFSWQQIVHQLIFLRKILQQNLHDDLPLQFLFFSNSVLILNDQGFFNPRIKFELYAVDDKDTRYGIIIMSCFSISLLTVTLPPDLIHLNLNISCQPRGVC